MNRDRWISPNTRRGPRFPSLPRGFTLVEILIGIFILSLLLGLCSLSFTNLSPKLRLKRTAWELNSRLHYARHKAVFSGQKVKMCFGPTYYSIEKYDEKRKLWDLDLRQDLEGVTVEANNCPIFHPAGTVSNLATILVFNSWGTYRITIAISGRIKIILL